MSAQDDARFEAMLDERAAHSREKTARPVELNVDKSF